MSTYSATIKTDENATEQRVDNCDSVETNNLKPITKEGDKEMQNQDMKTLAQYGDATEDHQDKTKQPTSKVIQTTGGKLSSYPTTCESKPETMNSEDLQTEVSENGDHPQSEKSNHNLKNSPKHELSTPLLPENLPKETTVKNVAENGCDNTIQIEDDHNHPLEESTLKPGTINAEGNIKMKNENLNPTPETIATPLPEGVTEEPRDDTNLHQSIADIINDDADTEPAPAAPYIPGGITREPQSPDQVHLDDVEAITKALEVYMATTDDNGALFGALDKYERLKEVIALKVDDDLQNKEGELTNAIDAAADFTEHLILKMGMIDGTLTSYKVMAGQAWNKAKTLFYAVRKNAPTTTESAVNESGSVITRKTKWSSWIIKHSRTQKSQRYIQVCQQLAQAEDALNYAFLGQERELAMIRVAKDIQIEANGKVTEPIIIGDLIRNHELEFDMSDDPSPTKDQLAQIDFIPFRHRMDKIAQRYNFTYDDLNLNRDLVIEAIQSKPKPFTNEELKQFCIVKRTNGDPNVHLEAILNNDGNREGFPEIDFEKGVKALKPILKQATDIFSYIALPETEIEFDSDSLELVKEIASTFNDIIEKAENSVLTTESE